MIMNRQKKTKRGITAMKSLYTSLVAMLALFVFASVAVADPGTTWDKKVAGSATDRKSTRLNSTH